MLSRSVEFDTSFLLGCDAGFGSPCVSVLVCTFPYAYICRLILYSSWEMKEDPKGDAVGSRLTWESVWLWERDSV